MRSVINKTLSSAFYRQHAGFFLFFFVVFFGIVAPSQQLAYHYALIRGIIEAPVFLLLVAFGWLLYAIKTIQFVLRILDSPEGLFLTRLRSLKRSRCFWLLWRVQHRLFLPVSGYALAVVVVALIRGAWVVAAVVPGNVGLICLVAAALYYRRLAAPRMKAARGRLRWMGSVRWMRSGWRAPYWSMLMRFLLVDSGWLLAGIKVFSCGLLYLMLRQQWVDYDLRPEYFSYIVVLFGHGILQYRCRRLEMARMSWYRALPFSLGKRLAQYGMVWLLLLAPEMLMLGWMIPHPIRLADGLEMVITGYSLLFLIGCCLMVTPIKVGNFLRLWLVLFGIWYVCVLGGFLIAMSGFFAGAAVILFLRGYYRFQAE